MSIRPNNYDDLKAKLTGTKDYFANGEYNKFKNGAYWQALLNKIKENFTAPEKGVALEIQNLKFNFDLMEEIENTSVVEVTDHVVESKDVITSYAIKRPKTVRISGFQGGDVFNIDLFSKAIEKIISKSKMVGGYLPEQAQVGINATQEILNYANNLINVVDGAIAQFTSVGDFIFENLPVGNEPNKWEDGKLSKAMASINVLTQIQNMRQPVDLLLPSGKEPNQYIITEVNWRMDGELGVYGYRVSVNLKEIKTIDKIETRKLSTAERNIANENITKRKAEMKKAQTAGKDAKISLFKRTVSGRL